MPGASMLPKITSKDRLLASAVMSECEWEDADQAGPPCPTIPSPSDRSSISLREVTGVSATTEGPCPQCSTGGRGGCGRPHPSRLLWTAALCVAVLLVALVAAWCGYSQANYGYIQAAWLWTRLPKADLVQPALCNPRLLVPELNFSRRWRLDSESLEICEQRNEHHFGWQWPHNRNWCWIGYKAMCHAHLKAHRPWRVFQEWAANDNRTAPRATHPFDPLEDAEVCDRPASGRSRAWTAREQHRARVWFRTHVRVYVLNMRTDTKRWEMIAGRLRDLQIEATRVYGVDMRQPKTMQTAMLAGWVPKAYNFTKAQDTAYSKKHAMGSILGTLGCASAHFKAQKEALEGGSPLAVVLEDDSWPVEDFVERLWSLVHRELPCDWEVVSLASRCPYGKCVSRRLSRVQPDHNEPAWRCHQGVNWGMQGVLYRTALLKDVQRVWQQQVFDESRPHCMDVDVALASISDRVAYYAVPSGQDPGFLKETNHPSARWTINVAGRRHPVPAFKIDPSNIG